MESGEESVPDFLHAPKRRASTGISFRSVDGIPGNAEICRPAEPSRTWRGDARRRVRRAPTPARLGTDRATSSHPWRGLAAHVTRQRGTPASPPSGGAENGRRAGRRRTYTRAASASTGPRAANAERPGDTIRCRAADRPFRAPGRFRLLFALGSTDAHTADRAAHPCSRPDRFCAHASMLSSAR